MKSTKKLLIIFLLFLPLFILISPKNAVSAGELPPGCKYTNISGAGDCPTNYTVRCLNTIICCQKAEQCEAAPTPLPKNVVFKMCQGDNKCEGCMFVHNTSVVSGKTWTALGCIPTDSFNNFVSWFLGKAIFIASGIAFLLMAFGAIQILTSAGSPEKMKAGSELITSALSGLLLIILSVFLLKLIGVDILQLPGFGK